MIKIINDESGEPMFFVGSKEISKPNLLDVPQAEIVAFSETGTDGKKRVFTSTDIKGIEGMETVKAPDWLLKLSIS